MSWGQKNLFKKLYFTKRRCLQIEPQLNDEMEDGLQSALASLINNYYRVSTNQSILLRNSCVVLHEIPHHFRINTKPVLHEIAHSFEIIFLHEISHEYKI